MSLGVCCRWMNACRSVVASAEMIRDAAKLADPTAKGRYTFAELCLAVCIAGCKCTHHIRVSTNAVGGTRSQAVFCPWPTTTNYVYLML